MKAELNFIGSITTPYHALEECPNNIQQDGPLCHLVLYPEYLDGIKGLVQGQDIMILYWLGNSHRENTSTAYKSGKSDLGTFSLRTPHRPNPIGVAVLPIEDLEETGLTIKGLDCLNSTQLLDIKPAIYKETSINK